jgi:hypothetical protein
LPNDINDYLAKCCKLIDESKKDKKRVDPFTNNQETKETLNLLGYSVSAMLQEIKELKEDNWDKGPEPDKSSKHPGDIWVFIKRIQNYTIYIKLKIRNLNGYDQLFIMSFHPVKY